MKKASMFAMILLVSMAFWGCKKKKGQVSGGDLSHTDNKALQSTGAPALSNGKAAPRKAAKRGEAKKPAPRKKALPSWKETFAKKLKGKTNDPAMATLKAFIEKNKKIDRSNPRWKTQLPKPPKAKFSANNKYFWVLNTNKGEIKLRFFEKIAPMHVSSASYLTLMGFYDSIKFHRVIPRFMAQGGCPLGRGFGNPGYSIFGEYNKKYRHEGAGILSAANTGRPGTDGSQFFITFKSTPWLNGRHTVYGKVVSGMSVVRDLEKFSHLGRMGKLFIKSAHILVE